MLSFQEQVRIVPNVRTPDGKTISIAILPWDSSQHSEKNRAMKRLLANPSIPDNLWRVFLYPTETPYIESVATDRAKNIIGFTVYYEKSGFLKEINSSIPDGLSEQYMDLIRVPVVILNNPEEHKVCKEHGVSAYAPTYYFVHPKARRS